MSAGASITIKEFLASVGFRADENSLKTSLAKVAAFGAAVQLAAVGIYAGLIRVASGEAEIARKADLLGTSSEKLQELGYVASQSGASLDAVTRSMEALVSKNPRIKDAARALEVAGDRMKRMTDAQRKAYADNMGIDRSLIPMLISDTGKLKNEFQSMYAVAGYNAKEAAQASKEFMGEIGKLTTMVGMLAKSISLAFIGRIRHDVANLRKVIMENFDKIKSILEGMIKIVLRVAAVISAFAYRVIAWVSALVSWYDKLDDSQKKTVASAALLIAAWKLLNAGFLATPLGVIITGLAAIVALVDDYLTYMEGGESYFDWGPWADTIETARESVSKAMQAVGRFIQENRELLATVGQGVAIFLGLQAAIMGVTGVTALVGAAVKVLWGIIRANPLALLITAATLVYEYWGPISDFFANLWSDAVAALPDFGGWANEAVGKIKGRFGEAVAWVKEKLNGILGLLPDWVLEKMGMKPGGDTGAIDTALTNASAMTQTTLSPSPAQAASMTQNSQQNVNMEAKTEIHMHTSDPIAAGNQVADRQSQVNSDTVRHMRGAVR